MELNFAYSMIGGFKPEQAAMWFDWLIEFFFQDCSCDLVNVMLTEEQPKTHKLI